MKLIETGNWKGVHFKDRTILRTDRNIYSKPIWWVLINTIEVKETNNKGHYIVVEHYDS